MNRTATREPLTRQRIIDAAARLMDAEGLEAVTMRRLGRELGVEAMSLYNHVEGKETVLAGILERVMAQFELSEDQEADWIERIRTMSRTFRRLLLAHPNVIPLFSEQHGPMTSPEALRPVDVALDTLRQAGLSPEDTIHAYRAVVGFVIGSVLLEIGGFFDPMNQKGHVEAMAAAIPAGQLPRLMEMLPALHECDADTEFEHGLDFILTGLRAKFTASAPGG